MQRRFLLFLGALAPIALFTSRGLSFRPNGPPLPTDLPKLAGQLDQLAANIHTPADARRLVDLAADLFSDQTPPAWTRNSLRNRIAQAEFAAVADPRQLIPESRLAGAWNSFVDALQAPQETKASAAEIHNLRDAFLVTARISWNQSQTNPWTVPSIYATQPDGSVAHGCRAIESIRILWDLANMPENLKEARDRVSSGVLLSNLFGPPQKHPLGPSEGRVSFRQRDRSPIELATAQYIQAKGVKAFNNAVVTMLESTLA